MTSRRGPTVQDWLLLAVSLSFVTASVWLLLIGKGGTAPLAALAFFGACAAVAGWLILGKRRAHRLRSDPRFAVAVTGGVPIVADRRKVFTVSGGLLAFGLFLAATGAPIGTRFVVVSLVIAAFGGASLVALALGWRRGYSLTFTPVGLQLRSPSLVYLARWDAIAVGLATVNDQPIVAVLLHEPSRLIADAEVVKGDPVRARAKLARQLERSMGWLGAHLTIAGSAYGIDTLVLLRAMERYVAEPHARAELEPRGALDDHR